MNAQLLIDILPAFAKAAWLTLWMSTLAIVLGIAGGFVLNVAVQIAPPVGPAYRAYLRLFRGTPFLAQLFVLYFGLPQLGVTLGALQACVIGLGLYGTAYFAEIFRAAWQAVPRGQVEAARAFGFSRAAILRHIELPQAGRVAIPMLVNQATLILKESSVASIITVPELTMTAGTVVAETFSYMEPYLLLGLFYWALTLMLAGLGRASERLLATGAQRSA
jgi:His/Glu/Gln/Arg/opine family amino acid ABC transporter permease subunit